MYCYESVKISHECDLFSISILHGLPGFCLLQTFSVTPREIRVDGSWFFNLNFSWSFSSAAMFLQDYQTKMVACLQNISVLNQKPWLQSLQDKFDGDVKIYLIFTLIQSQYFVSYFRTKLNLQVEQRITCECISCHE